LAATFHPELSLSDSVSKNDSPDDLERNPDRRVHQYFVQIVRDALQAAEDAPPEPGTLQTTVANRE
ncbi:MAG: hypothetical protein V4587_03665, partial [Acidobacteriota bacterium]